MDMTIHCVSYILARGSRGRRSLRRSTFQGELTTVETVYGIAKSGGHEPS